MNCFAVNSLVIKCAFDVFSYSHTNHVNPRFEERPERYYRCMLRNLSIISTDLQIQVEKPGYYNRENLREMVWIENSDMTVLPAAIFEKFPNLNFFVIIDSKIQNLERSSFRNAYKLRKLTIDKVHLPRINSYTFADITTLEYLSLVNCDIMKLDSEAFKELDNLKGLYLTGNKMIVMEKPVFHPLVKLEEVFLDDNILKVLMGDLFKNNTRLRIASFGGNRIFIVDSEMFSHNHDLIYVNFLENSCIDREFNITNGNLNELNKSLGSCSESLHLYLLIIPFALLIVCLIGYSYHLAVIKKIKVFHRNH